MADAERVKSPQEFMGEPVIAVAVVAMLTLRS